MDLEIAAANQVFFGEGQRRREGERKKVSRCSGFGRFIRERKNAAPGCRAVTLIE